MPATSIKYIIADDHTIFRQGLRMVLADDRHLEFLAEAADGLELMGLLKRDTPDVILLDLKMPGMDGMEALRAIRAKYPLIKVLILTMNDEEQLILHLLEAGANGYLIKNADADEIRLAIHACYENGFYFSDYVSSLLLKTLVQKKKSNLSFKEAVSFNERELAVLKLICEGCTAMEIGKTIFLSHRTVEGIKLELQEKIGVRNTAGLIMYAVKQGIV